MAVIEYLHGMIWTGVFVLLCTRTNGNVSGKNCSKICITKECVQFAAYSLSKFDENIDPCDNFYGFVCGKYPEDEELSQEGLNEIPSQSSNRPMFDILSRIIENGPDQDTKSFSSKRKVIYESCLKFHDVQKELLELKKHISISFIPNWPFVIGSNEVIDINELLLKLILADYFAFFNFDINFITMDMFTKYFEDRRMTPPPAFQPKFKVSMWLTESMFDICPEVTEEKFTDFLYELIGELKIPRNNGKQIVEDAIRIERMFLNITNIEDDDTGIDCSNNSNRWCQIVYRVVEVTEADGNFEEADFQFRSPSKFLALDQFLELESSVAIANYLALRVILSNVGILSYFTKFSNFPCQTMLNKNQEHRFLGRRLSCSQFIATFSPMLLAPEYVRSRNISVQFSRMDNVLKHIINATMTSLDTSWMNGNMYKNYIESLTKTVISQMDYIHHVEVEGPNMYDDLQTDRKYFFKNIEALKSINRVSELKRYRERYTLLGLTRYNPFFANAGSGEDITVGFGFYEIPYSGLGVPELVDYSRFGFVLAHEVVHNIQFVISPHLNNETKAFIIYQDCVNDLYSKFRIPTLDILAQSEQTFAENMADLLGEKIAFRAFKDFIVEQGPLQKLPGLHHLSDEQLFFVLTAQVWCEFGSDFRKYIKNVHSPSVHRILGPPMNMESFAKAFGCGKRSHMNPNKKCQFPATDNSINDST